MIFKDYYKMLDFDTNKVTIEEIKANFRELAKKYHPDRNIGDQNKEERFKDMNEAYQVLCDTTARKKYDRMWNNYIGKKKEKQEESQRQTGSRLGDFFQVFLGQPETTSSQKTVSKNKKVPVRGENIETEIEISVQEAFYGTQQKIALRTVEGKMKTFSIKVPAGIRDKEKIRLLGQGKEGMNGAKNGDLFIQVHIKPDHKFCLDGYDLMTNLYVTPWEAALGAKVTLNTIDDTASIYIPCGIQSGEKIRIPGKGYKDGKGSRGDLVAEVKITVPKKLTEQEEELFERLQEISKFEPRKQLT